MFNSTFSAKPLSTWCIHKSHAFEMEPLYWAARIITSNHITRLWTTTKTPELIPSSGYLITGLLSVWLTPGWLLACRRFFTESRCVTHISTSSVLRRVCFASSSTSSESKSRLSFWAFSKLFLITVLGGNRKYELRVNRCRLLLKPFPDT